MFCRSDVQDQALILGSLAGGTEPRPILWLSIPWNSSIHPPCPLGGVGSQQEVDFAIDQKRELWYLWKEGAPIAQKTSGERMCVSRADITSPPPRDENTAQFQRGSLCTLLPQEAVAPSNPGEDRSLVAELSGPRDRWEQPDCGVLDRRLSIGWASV